MGQDGSDVELLLTLTRRRQENRFWSEFVNQEGFSVKCVSAGPNQYLKERFMATSVRISHRLTRNGKLCLIIGETSCEILNLISIFAPATKP